MLISVALLCSSLGFRTLLYLRLELQVIFSVKEYEKTFETE